MIKHIEDLKPSELLAFLDNWNLNKANIQVTEKVDGMAMGFGLTEDGQFYLNSKNVVFLNKEDIPNLWFMKDFKRYYSLIENIPISEIITGLSTKYGFNFEPGSSIKINGEGVPSFDHNIVIYDEKKIGDGVFVIFSTNIAGQEVRNVEFWKDLATEFNKHSKIRFYAVPEIDLSSLTFDDELVVSLRDLIEKSGNILKKPARTPAEKEAKRRLLSLSNELGKKAKGQVLQTKINPTFGNEYEGLVVALPNGNLVKVVDKNKFTARKESNWHFIDLIQTAKNSFKKSIKHDPQNIDKYLDEFGSSIQGIEKDFETNKDKFITISKKELDTKQEINLAKKTILVLKKLLKNNPPEQISKKFLEKEITVEGVQHRVLTEGGNVFKQVNSTVPKNLIKTNIENAMKIHGLENLHYEIVGNIDKPFVGDIDVAIDSKELTEKFDLHKETFWEDLSNYLSKFGDDFKIIKGLSQFHLLAPLLDEQGKQLPAFSKEGEALEEPGMIQIDFFVGNSKWLKDIFSGAEKSSKYKAKYRNLFLASIFSQLKWFSKKNPNIFNKFRIGPNGFLLIQKEIDKNKEKKISEHSFSVDANMVARVLFGKDTKWQDINSFEKLFNLFNSEKFRFKNRRKEIIENYLQSLKRAHLNVPKELT